ncbi:MAG: DUF115 domain-containing protein [Desulfobacteraceae bacterium]|nr:DUF115 domain-containing protein [Desulfobacteraceae bacterium]
MSENQSDVFKSNMNLLKKNHPHIWEMMTKNPPEPEGEIILTPNGEPNLWTEDTNGNRVSLHIPENPRAEINDAAKAVIEDFDGTLILTGMGLGFCPLGLIELRKDIRHLVIFEPNAGIFLQALKAMDLSPLFSDPRVILGIGENQNIENTLAPAVKALQLESIQHIQHNASFSLDFSKYNTVYENINRYTDSANLEGGTFLKIGFDFFSNRLKNINSIHHNFPFDDLKEKHKGLPAIIVSTGPSLDKDILTLKQAKGKAIILAVDSAVPALIKNEIMPDYVSSIDPVELIYEKIAGIANQLHDVSLICMSWVASKMAKLFPAEKIFWCFMQKPIDQWMGSLIGSKIATGGASSVSHLSFLSANWMGCSPIVFLGQDLCLSESKSHSSATALSANEYVNQLLKNKKEIIYIDDVHGKKVPSKRTFLSQKLFFERMIIDRPGHYINSTTNGVHIEGTEVMPLQEAIDSFCTIDINKIDKEDINDLSVDNKIRPSINDLTGMVQVKIKRCNQIQRMLKDEKHLIDDLFKSVKKINTSKTLCQGFNDLSASNQKKMLKLDKIGKKLDNATDIWPLMQEVTMAGLRKSERQKHAIDLLANNPEKYTQWFKKTLERLQTINNVRKDITLIFSNALKNNISFIKSETNLLSKINNQKNQKQDDQRILELIRLYFDAGNVALAQPWIKIISETMKDSPELNFFLGITAAHYTEYDKSELFFAKAVKTNPEYIPQIEEFREQQGNAYISYARIFDQKSKTIAKRLLLKGLTYAPDHKQLKLELKFRGDLSIAEIKSHEEAKKLSETEDMIDSWLDDLSSNQELANIIDDENASQLYQYKGIILVDKDELDPAIEHFNKSLDIAPDNPALHIVLTNVYFARQEFAQGIYHLKQAVSLDNVYAVYWEEIGDELMQSEQFEDALAAFENCFLKLPERVHLLKKIGDCYKETGQLEAAREAYAKLNSLLKES